MGGWLMLNAGPPGIAAWNCHVMLLMGLTLHPLPAASSSRAPQRRDRQQYRLVRRNTNQRVRPRAAARIRELHDDAVCFDVRGESRQHLRGLGQEHITNVKSHAIADFHARRRMHVRWLAPDRTGK